MSPVSRVGEENSAPQRNEGRWFESRSRKLKYTIKMSDSKARGIWLGAWLSVIKCPEIGQKETKVCLVNNQIKILSALFFFSFLKRKKDRQDRLS